MVVVGVVGRTEEEVGGASVIGTVGRKGSCSVYVVGRGAGEATKNVGASISDQVLVGEWTRGSYIPQLQSKKDHAKNQIKLDL